jgi:hypothetical protein
LPELAELVANSSNSSVAGVGGVGGQLQQLQRLQTQLSQSPPIFGKLEKAALITIAKVEVLPPFSSAPLRLPLHPGSLQLKSEATTPS